MDKAMRADSRMQDALQQLWDAFNKRTINTVKNFLGLEHPHFVLRKLKGYYVYAIGYLCSQCCM